MSWSQETRKDSQSTHAHSQVSSRVCPRLRVCLHLWCEKLLDPGGQEWNVQNTADGRPLSGIAFEELCQQRAQFLGIVDGDGGIGATDDLQHQVLHVPSLKLRTNMGPRVKISSKDFCWCIRSG